MRHLHPGMMKMGFCLKFRMAHGIDQMSGICQGQTEIDKQPFASSKAGRQHDLTNTQGLPCFSLRSHHPATLDISKRRLSLRAVEPWIRAFEGNRPDLFPDPLFEK
jgi:hypothetical protein